MSEPLGQSEPSDPTVFTSALVVFLGPPCSGKTLAYLSDYPNYERFFGPSELSKDKSSLHSVIQTVKKALGNGQSVVIDDVNYLERTRSSYLKVATLLKQTRMITTKAILFLPQGGIEQCQYQNEWNVARNLELEEAAQLGIIPSTSLPYYKEPTMGTFQEWKQYPLSCNLNPNEGFDQIERRKTPLNAFSIPFFRPALFIPLQAIVSIAPMVSANNPTPDWNNMRTCLTFPSISEAIQEWHSANPDAVTMVLIDENVCLPTHIMTIVDPVAQGKIVLDIRSRIEESLSSLKLTSPLYYLIAEYNAFEETEFFRMPCYGMLGWSQFRHKIDLQKSVWIKCPELNGGIPPGMMTITNSQFFASSGWDVGSKLRKHGFRVGSFPAFLNDIHYNSPYFDPSAQLSQHQDHIQPIIDKNKHKLETHANDFILDTHIVLTEDAGRGRVHGCVIPLTVSDEQASQQIQLEIERLERSIPTWVQDGTPAPQSEGDQPQSALRSLIKSEPMNPDRKPLLLGDKILHKRPNEAADPTTEPKTKKPKLFASASVPKLVNTTIPKLFARIPKQQEFDDIEIIQVKKERIEVLDIDDLDPNPTIPVRMQIDVDVDLLGQLQNHATNYSPPPVVRARHRRSTSMHQDDQLMNDLWDEPAITTTPAPSTIYSYSPPGASHQNQPSPSLHPASQPHSSLRYSPQPAQALSQPHLRHSPQRFLQASPFSNPSLDPSQPSRVSPEPSRQPSQPSSQPSRQASQALENQRHEVNIPHPLFNSSPDLDFPRPTSSPSNLDLPGRASASPPTTDYGNGFAPSPSRDGPNYQTPLEPETTDPNQEKPNWSVTNQNAFGFLFG